MVYDSGSVSEKSIFSPCGTCHARVLEGVAKSQSALKAVVIKLKPDTVALDLDPFLHYGVVQPIEQTVGTKKKQSNRFFSRMAV